MINYLTPDPIVCEIRNGGGAIKVDLSDTTQATVDIVSSTDRPQGFLDDVLRTVTGWGAQEPPDATGEPTEDVVVDFQDGNLVVDTEPARRRWHRDFIVRITAPAGSGVRARSETASVAVTGRTDRVEIKTATGNVDVESSHGNSVVRTVSGDITIRHAVNGTIDAAAVSGALTLGVEPGVAARVDLSTVSGRARSELPVHPHLDGSELTVKGRTVSGDITLSSALPGAT